MPPVRATVGRWNDDEGWGVLRSPATPGGCWVHFSAVRTAGHRGLHAGDDVLAVVEQADQDGYDYRAIGCWPAAAEPVDEPPDPPGAAYRSSLSLTSDQDGYRA